MSWCAWGMVESVATSVDDPPDEDRRDMVNEKVVRGFQPI
jgi:hypothetical protein